jgi:glycosyltransferase involved in cell wall biosynthesis
MVICENVFRADGTPIFDPKLLDGIPHTLLTTKELHDAERIHKLVADWRPQAVGICGWHVPAFRALTQHPDLQHVRFLMGMDTQRKDTLRQRLGRYRMASYFARIDRVIAASERSWQLGRLLGFPESKLRRGFYGIDARQLAGVMERRMATPGGWPRRFLFVGRYVHEKAVDVMCDAYTRYRSRVNDPWPLTTCGAGPEEARINATPGIENRGFLQPYDLPDALATSGVFILASRYEPWGVVLAEAAYTGMPIICTEACGASLDVVRSHYNGLSIATGDPEALAKAMVWMHEHHDRFPEMGRRGQWLAGAYTADVWAERWEEAFREIIA